LYGYSNPKNSSWKATDRIFFDERCCRNCDVKCDLVGLIRFLKGEPVKFKDYLQVILGGSGKFVVWKKDRQREAAGRYEKCLWISSSPSLASMYLKG